jgi:BirA family transcriptional regulator, biotin operon repressor / biotin---[acetyl-CoA-carboxylase] ligase
VSQRSAEGGPGGLPPGESGPLSAESLRGAVAVGGLWTDVTVVAETGSTNADLVAAARAGAPEGLVLVAETQTAGRGRMGRGWASKAGAALTFSVLLRPAAVPLSARGWLPLLTGVAVAAGIRDRTGQRVSLKWPNDVLAAGPGATGAGKLAGILAEQAGDAVVIGTGLNVLASPVGLPPGTATSLAELGAAGLDRAGLLAAFLRELERWYAPWIAAAGDADACGLRAEYLRWCGTVGREVRVELPGGASLAGRAEGIDSLGRLLVAGQPISAGDVVHVR